ncbi:sulfite exporter TauE/SafE family protein [Megalodesulfovibrio paquesii]
MAAVPDIAAEALQFIDLSMPGAIFLFLVGVVGGLVSGFIGSGGAFVLTPGMMSLGVPGPIAVASNMCHKFPKALVGAMKRYKYGQVDVKMGLIIGISAEVGVQIGVQVQKWILDSWGEAGSNLYVSLSFVVILLVVGSIVYKDAINLKKTGAVEKPTALSAKVRALNIWPMITFKRSGIRCSFWVTAPLGFATGMMAATIAVGGFVGVPGMIYLLGMTSLMASATELVIAFVMGLGGTAIWAWYGMVDIRLTLIILAGSLLGVQLGAIGTTYVKDYMIKYVMATIMLIVAVSRALAMPKYLTQLGLMSVGDSTLSLLSQVSFVSMCAALVIGAVIILKAMFKGLREEKASYGAACEHA